MRFVYGLVGIVLLLVALGSCVAGKSETDTIVGTLLLIAGLITLFAGDILYQLRRISEALDELKQRMLRNP